jgi:transposase
MFRHHNQLRFNVGTLVEYELPPDSFCGQLATYRTKLFKDEDFAFLYSASKVGRPCISPSQMATLLLLQYHFGVADGEAVERSACDLRWAAALGRMPGTPLCDRTTLVVFRGKLVLKNRLELIFDKAIQHARELGLLKGTKLKLLIDTRAVVGRGAVEDTYNLIGRAMDRVMDVLAKAAGEATEQWAAARELSRYVRRRDSSLKGQMEIDWSDPAARQKALATMVKDAQRLLGLADERLSDLDDELRATLEEETSLLRRILEQDVDEGEPPSGDHGPGLREGTSKDRSPSATDPEQRHGRKSASRKFCGHKARVAVDAESQLIIDVEVLDGNAGDAHEAVAQVKRAAERAKVDVEATVGDCAFAGVETRKEFAAEGYTLHAKQPATAQPQFGIPKSRFQVLLDGDSVVSVVCPVGRVVTERKVRKDGTQIFNFAPHCSRCPLRHKCVSAQHIKKGRSIHVHPGERLMQEARAFQETPEGRTILRERVAVEHALARLARLGIGQARYIGKRKTHFQLLMSATVANLRLTWNRANATDTQDKPGEGPDGPNGTVRGGTGATGAAVAAISALSNRIWTLGTAWKQRRPAISSHLSVCS